jgi:hypothetical protein
LHIFVAVWVLLASFRWGDWENFKLYYPTMLYIALSNLLYVFLAHEFFHLWELREDIGTHAITFLIHAFIINPFSTFLFLSNYPSTLKSKILHTLKWISLFLIVEWIGYKLDKITYHNGWNYWWSVAFNFLWVIMLRFHYLKPISAWVVSFLFTAFFIIYFHVPLPEP